MQHRIPMQVPRYVDYYVPRIRYTVTCSILGTRDVHVHVDHIRIFGERLAVTMRAWGDVRDRWFQNGPMGVFSCPNAAEYVRVREDFLKRVYIHDIATRNIPRLSSFDLAAE